jgi:DNA-binding NarL/FixJ family response regulator
MHASKDLKILIVDDHDLILDATRRTVSGIRPDAQILQARTCEGALDLVADTPDLDLIFLDLGLPECVGLEALVRLRAVCDYTRIVVLSGSEDPDQVRQTLELGALGFIPKALPMEQMVLAIQLVLAGGVYIPATAIARISPNSARAPENSEDREAHLPNEPRDAGSVLNLTPQQYKVARLVAAGASNKAIARELGLSEPTVKKHVSDGLLRQLKVGKRTEAIAEISRRRLLFNRTDHAKPTD